LADVTGRIKDHHVSAGVRLILFQQRVFAGAGGEKYLSAERVLQTIANIRERSAGQTRTGSGAGMPRGLCCRRARLVSAPAP
jgi:hypothetical protein